MRLGLLKPSRMGTAACSAMLFVITSAVAVPVTAQTYKVVVDFTSQSPSLLAVGPAAAQGRDGNFYGTSVTGGTNDLGTVFKITPSGTLATLYSFDGTVGEYPYGGLTLGADGNFYGAANRGGPSGFGSIFKITPTGVVTALHSFTNYGEGTNPSSAPVQGADGNFYGSTSGVDVSTTEASSTIYKLTPAGVFTVLHTLAPGTDGSSAGPVILGADGSFYGGTASGGTNGWGTLFKVTPGGAFTLLHTFSNSADGRQGATLAQAANGTFYGATYLGGANGVGVVIKITSTGTFTKLHDLNGTTDGSNVTGNMFLGTDGNFYNVAASNGANSGGTIFKVSPAGVFTKVLDFGGANLGVTPGTGLIQATSGLFYGSTQNGGTGNASVFYSLNESLSAFASLVSTSGRVGSKIGILGQGFSASSVVKFNGVKATTVTRTGTTFLLATVPAGATNGFVTVTTGATTLTSSRKFVVHNSWGKGAVLPVAVQFPATGTIGSKIYVVGGATATALVNDNQVYTTGTNTWSTAAPIPTTVYGPASAVVNGILYVIGGYTGGTGPATGIVQAYNPTTNTWTTKTAMPTARGSTAAVVNNGIIYVIGGNGATPRLNTVEKFDPATDIWTEEATLLVGKSEPSAGLLGTIIVSPDGFTTSQNTGDNESYDVSTNKWSALTPDPTPRNASCYGTLLGQLYMAGGSNDSSPLALTESFSVTANKWTTQAAVPQAVIAPGSALAGGLLYCFGGSNTGVAFSGSVYNNVQIYQP